MSKIHAAIVDDERPARRKMRRFLESEADVLIVGEAGDGPEAVEMIKREKPDLVYLDVQMPGFGGFDVIGALHVDPMPQIIFVTAHDQFALRAFEVHALDYLLKPFDQERFRRVLNRAREHFKMRDATHDLDEKINTLLREIRDEARYAERLLVNSGGRAFFLQVGQINWVEAAKNYVEIHAGENAYLLRGTIDGLYRRLNPTKFIRANRSQIINIESIKELQPWFHGEYRIILKDGAEMKWSRRYLDRTSDLFIRQF